MHYLRFHHNCTRETRWRIKSCRGLHLGGEIAYAKMSFVTARSIDQHWNVLKRADGYYSPVPLLSSVRNGLHLPHVSNGITQFTLVSSNVDVHLGKKKTKTHSKIKINIQKQSIFNCIVFLLVLGTLTAAKAINLFCQSWISNNRTHHIMLLNRQQEDCEFWLDGNLVGSDISSYCTYQGLCTGFWILPLSSGPLDEFVSSPPKKRLTRKLNVQVSYGEHNEAYKGAQFEEMKCHFCVIV